jgi:hypothetical protein
MDTDDAPSHEPSDAVAFDDAQHEVATQAPAPAERAPEAQDIPVAVDESGQGWGLVGLYKADVGDTEIDPPGGEVTLEDGGEGLTKLVLTGAEPDTTVHVYVTQRDDSIT